MLLTRLTLPCGPLGWHLLLRLHFSWLSFKRAERPLTLTRNFTRPCDGGSSQECRASMIRLLSRCLGLKGKLGAQMDTFIYLDLIIHTIGLTVTFLDCLYFCHFHTNKHTSLHCLLYPAGLPLPPTKFNPTYLLSSCPQVQLRRMTHTHSPTHATFNHLHRVCKFTRLRREGTK